MTNFQGLRWCRTWQSTAVVAVITAQLVIADDLVVQTASGPVRGVLEENRRVFRGIPYAAPPVGDLRFRAPAAHPGWKDVLDAKDFGACCPQFQGGCWATSIVTNQSEDCLTTNVIAPRAPSDDPNGYAVMVYIHAGEFRCGCSNDLESRSFSAGDRVIFVSFNYRIGALGFLADDSLRDRHPEGSTGNYGLLDQRAAMEWVQKNIAAFGGNPSAVTLWGESSGGTSVAYHMLAAGRGQGQPFQRAILQSPGLGQVKTWQDAKTNAEFLFASLASIGSPHCELTPGFIEFKDDDSFSYQKPLKQTPGQNLKESKRWCEKHENCSGFAYRPEQNETSFYTGPVYVSDVEALERAEQPLLFLKRGPVSAEDRVRCLMSANSSAIEWLTESVPRDDTFQTDGWAPVIDGVTLPSTLMKQIHEGKLPAKLDVLLGSNLDEGTEFMDLSPKLSCNASKEQFQWWAKKFLGPDISKEVLNSTLYSPQKLSRPLPACQEFEHFKPQKKIGGEEAVYFNAAMRIAGDVSVSCPTTELAAALKGRTYRYLFRHTPIYSQNVDDTSTWGAFHGAEVPFVFGAKFELNNTVELQLSAIMGCFWSSFAEHGSPSLKDCGTNAFSNLTWAPFEEKDSIVMTFDANTSAKLMPGLFSRRCKALGLPAWTKPKSILENQVEMTTFV
eukprot:TRINITY_DN68548_c0_g1_i1.p1 TRINITY_DN68548_c0_g1~~TRINITY_DN68548_c0_g1_i1.p1  ORF type:complete len:671 (-),score=108.86 TRINITY_DN68548_c0_g1_i1:25-2037(-)